LKPRSCVSATDVRTPARSHRTADASVEIEFDLRGFAMLLARRLSDAAP